MTFFRYLHGVLIGLFCLLPQLEASSSFWEEFSEQSKMFPITVENVKESHNDNLLKQLPAEELPIEVEVGMVVMSIDSFEDTKKTFSATFWVWFIYDAKYKDVIKPHQTFEVINFLTKESVSEFEELTEDALTGERKIWSGRKIRGIFKHNWDLANFPSDEQVLELQIDESQREAKYIVYKADTSASTFFRWKMGDEKDNHIPGWKIDGFKVMADNVIHTTTYGDPALRREPGAAAPPSSVYSAFRAEIKLSRTAWATFLKIHSVVFAAFLLSWIALLLNPQNPNLTAARIGVLVAMVYSVALNIQHVDILLGLVPEMILPDKIQCLTLSFIVLFFIETVLGQLYLRRDLVSRVKRLDRLVFLYSIFLYLILLFVIIIWK